MGFDRRTMCLGLASAMATRCARAEGPPARQRQAEWSDFKAAFLDPSGRIVDSGNGGISHSEGQGYGLAFALSAGDRAAFDLISRWTRDNLAHPDIALHSWRYDPRLARPVGDANNATDGDIFIAWALGCAGRKWQDSAYLARAADIRSAIRARLVIQRHGRQLLLPGLEGFVTDDHVTLNPSYFVWPALDAFRRLDGQGIWGRLIADSAAILAAARFGPLALPTDWIDISGAGQLQPSASNAPRFGFDAIRIPLYALAGGRSHLVRTIADFWRGYGARGQPIPAWVDVETGETAPYPLSPGGRAIVNRLLSRQAPSPLDGDYYSAALQLLALDLA